MLYLCKAAAGDDTAHESGRENDANNSHDNTDKPCNNCFDDSFTTGLKAITIGAFSDFGCAPRVLLQKKDRVSTLHLACLVTHRGIVTNAQRIWVSIVKTVVALSFGTPLVRTPVVMVGAESIFAGFTPLHSVVARRAGRLRRTSVDGAMVAFTATTTPAAMVQIVTA